MESENKKDKMALPKVIFSSAIDYGAGSIFKGLVNTFVPKASLITNLCRMLVCDCAGVYVGRSLSSYAIEEIEEISKSIKEAVDEYTSSEEAEEESK